MITTAKTTSQSTSQSQSTTIQLPNGAQVDSVTVDSGNVSWSHDIPIEQLTCSLSNGSIVNTTSSTETLSKSVGQTDEKDSSSSSSAPSFPSSVSYSDSSGYSGTEYPSGSPYTMSSYSATKTGTQSGTRDVYYKYTTGSGWAYDHTTNAATQYPTMSYDDGQYAGTLNQTSYSYGAVTAQTLPSNPSNGQVALYSTTPWTAQYSGTCTGYVWGQDYSGTATKQQTVYTNYYAYTVTVKYHVNANSRFRGVRFFGAKAGHRGLVSY